MFIFKFCFFFLTFELSTRMLELSTVIRQACEYGKVGMEIFVLIDKLRLIYAAESFLEKWFAKKR